MRLIVDTLVQAQTAILARIKVLDQRVMAAHPTIRRHACS